MNMLTCIKQHLSNIWSLIHEKVKQDRGWAEKSVSYEKKACYVHNTNKIWAYLIQMEGLIEPSSLIAVLYSSRRTMTNREIYVSYKTKLDACKSVSFKWLRYMSSKR